MQVHHTSVTIKVPSERVHFADSASTTHCWICSPDEQSSAEFNISRESNWKTTMPTDINAPRDDKRQDHAADSTSAADDQASSVRSLFSTSLANKCAYKTAPSVDTFRNYSSVETWTHNSLISVDSLNCCLCFSSLRLLVARSRWY